MSLQARIDDATQLISNGKKKMADHQAEIPRIDARFDETLKRYRELTGGAPQSGETARAAQ